MDSSRLLMLVLLKLLSCRRSESSRDDSLDGGARCQELPDDGAGVCVRDSRSVLISCFKKCAHIATRATPIRMYKDVITMERTSSVESLTEFQTLNVPGWLFTDRTELYFKNDDSGR